MFLRRLRYWLGGGKRRRELQEEMELHIAEREAELREKGFGESEARFEARRRFGNLTRTVEEGRDIWTFVWFDLLLADIRYAFRTLRQSPGFTAVVILTLSLGIGANTALFTVVNEAFMRKLPVRDPDTLVHLRYAGPNDMVTSSSDYGNVNKEGDRAVRTTFSYPMFEQFLNANRTLDNMTATAPFGTVNLVVGGAAEVASAFIHSGNYYRLLGVDAFLGRIIVPEDDQPGAPPVALISHGYWTRRFGGDAQIVGKTVQANNIPVTIVGVTPPDFAGIQTVGSPAPDISFPLSLEPQLVPQGPSELLGQATYWWLQITGRLKPGVTQQQVRGNLEGVFQAKARSGMDEYLASLTPEQREAPNNRNLINIPKLRVSSASRGIYDVDGDHTLVMIVLGAVVTLVLLIVCANIANLLLSRATMRQREISVRLSLGATRARLIRQLLVESVLLASIGAGFGLLVAYWGRRAWQEPSGPFLDWRVLAFTCGLAVFTGILFGIAPAFNATRRSLGDALRESSRSVIGSRSRLGKSLMAVQVAISLVLLVGAGLFLRTLQNLRSVDVGFDAQNIVLFRVDPQLIGYDQPRIRTLYRQLVERLQGTPGVASVSLSYGALMSGNVNITRFAVQNGPEAQGGISLLTVGPGFFETMKIPVVSGRSFTFRDDQTAPKVAMINEAAARKYFPNSDPVGRRFGNLPETSGDYEIIGVVRDTSYSTLREPPPPVKYMPLLQGPLRGATFELRTSIDDAADAIVAVRQTVREIDPNLPVTNVSTQIEQIEGRVEQERTFASAYALFGGLALFISAIGLFGLMSYSVTRRTNEIGIRMALGATKNEILGFVLSEALRVVGVGLVLGLATALALNRFISSLLFGLAPNDLLSITAATSLMTTVALLAAYLPARRAANVDPVVALRHD